MRTVEQVIGKGAAGDVGGAGAGRGSENCVTFVHVGSVQQWQVLLQVWDRYQHVQMLDHDSGFCEIADHLSGHARPDVLTRTVISDSRLDRKSRGIFLGGELLDELHAGCLELQKMINSDVAGCFRPGSAEPLLTAQEERVVRLVIRTVEAVMEDRWQARHKTFRRVSHGSRTAGLMMRT
jgi:hypothetical protein